MKSDEFPKLIFLDWQEGDEWLIKSKGWFSHNNVELANGNRYQVFFVDTERLNQELDNHTADGNPFFIENSLIVLPEVTVENMRKAVIEAEKRKFFDNLIPIT